MFYTLLPIRIPPKRCLLGFAKTMPGAQFSMDTKFLMGLRMNNRLLDNKFIAANFFLILVFAQN
jgi:hypothetical protein